MSNSESEDEPTLWLKAEGEPILCWPRAEVLDLVPFPGRFTVDSMVATFLASWALSIFSLLLSSMSHCVRRASGNQEQVPATSECQRLSQS